jgi:hypothetical protein
MASKPKPIDKNQLPLLSQDAIHGPRGLVALEELARRCQSCEKCGLHESRSRVVLGEGPWNRPKLMIVGEVEFIQGSLNKFFLKELCQYGSTTPAPYKKACALHKQDDGFIMGYSLIKEEDKKSKLSPNLIF